MRARLIATGTTAVSAVVLVAAIALYAQRIPEGPARPPQRNGHVQTFWPAGTLKADVSYRNDAYDGDYRTYYAGGAPYEVRHYVDGHEQGLQQSWSEDGTAYLNYEVRNGRRYGLVNASPCTVVGHGEDDAVPRAATHSVRAALPARDVTGPPAGVASGALPFYADASFTPHWAPVEHRVAPFALVTQTGGIISGAALAGRPYVASFIYTQCAAVCPILVTQLARVQDAAPRGTRIVSFSVTPDSDTPQVLAAFGRERGIDPRTWSLVTGDRRLIYDLARTSFFADDDRVGAGDATDFLHTEKLLLVDGDGRLRGIYNGTQPHAVDQLITDLSALALD